MLIGERLRELRKAKGLTQDALERLTGIKRNQLSCYENCHFVPSLEILERLAVALGVPLWQLFYGIEAGEHQETGKDERDRFLDRLRPLLARMDKRSCRLLLRMARGIAKRNRLPPCG
jgi:transcriptional regulator with XRE-family HTH domain